MTKLRERWIQQICKVIAISIGHHPLLGPARVASDGDDLNTLRALVVLRIAVLDARGQDRARIVGLLATHPVFADPKPDEGQLSSLVNHVLQRMELEGFTGADALGLGLRVEDPESTYALVLEHWSRRRCRATAATQAVKELVRHWGVESSSTAESLAARSLIPLQTYSGTFWPRVGEKLDSRVQQVVSFALAKKGSEAGDLWGSGFPHTAPATSGNWARTRPAIPRPETIFARQSARSCAVVRSSLAPWTCSKSNSRRSPRQWVV
ncbi:hypothetical protein [Streptomyces sp. CA-132043]|uniref:hypothetical protein n=1 Tax=Streptomyces sp. CA-132043 TaxID=3240048 RepID=UPI003D89C4AC